MNNSTISEPLISIIVPVYNVELYLSRCIDSIINQTYKNLEIILVDDGSTDNCGIICDDYEKKDSRIKVIHKKNGGQAEARNRGLDLSVGEYIVFIDSDDYIDEHMIEVLYCKLKEDNSDMAICNYMISNEDENHNICHTEPRIYLKNEIVEYDDIWKRFLGKEHIAFVIACNKIYKKKLFYNVKYAEGKVYEDEYIIHRLLGQCKRISFVEKPLYFYLIRNGSTTNREYSIKKMDMVEAMIDRTEYSISHDLCNIMKKSFLSAVGYLSYGFFVLDLKNEDDKARLTKLHSHIKKIYPKVKETLSFLERIRVLMFCVSPGLYNFVYKYVERFIHTSKN